MTTTATDTTTAVQEVIADAKAAGLQLVADARDAARTMLTHLAAEATAEIPKVAGMTINVLTDFIPASLRADVAPFLSAAAAGTAHTVQAGMATTIQRALGIALARIDATLGTTTTTSGA